jgi:hypothetical protein
MAKNRKTIITSLPTYHKDRQQWRREILNKALSAALSAGVYYDRDDHLEVVVLLYLKKGKRLLIHDVNRLKDILDALQKKFRSSKSCRTLTIGSSRLTPSTRGLTCSAP